MGVATGQFVLPNGSPVGNGAYQWKLSGDAIQFAIPSCDAPRLFGGNLDANGNMTATFAFNDALSTTAGLTTTYQLTIKDSGGGQVWCENYYLTGTAANLNLIPPGGSGPGPVTVVSNGLPAGQLGDIIRYNVAGDGQWDAVNYAAKQAVIYWDNVGSPQQYGCIQTGVNIAAPLTQNVIYPTTYLDSPGRQLVGTTSPSTNTTIGMSTGQNSNYGTIPFGSWYRWTHRFAANQSVNVRYWMGVGCYCNGGTGNDGTVILSSAAYATDTPNKSTIGFRYSAGTDTTWQAVCITSGVSAGTQTTVNTGIPIDTNVHTFETLPVVSAAGVLSSINFAIDRVIVASIATNIPSGLYTGTCGCFGMPFWTGDNKNTANSISGTYYYMMLSLR
jgi:hypothetical protein